MLIILLFIFQMPPVDLEIGICTTCREIKYLSHKVKGVSNFNEHTRKCKGPKKTSAGFVCQTCKKTFTQRSKWASHPHNQELRTEKKFVRYTQKPLEKTVVHLVKNASPLQVVEVSFQEKWQIEDLCPSLFIPAAYRPTPDWHLWGDPNGTALVKNALVEKIRCGRHNEIFLHRNILVVNEDGQELSRMTENILRPNAVRIFDIQEHTDEVFRVSLRNPPKNPDLSHLRPQPLDDIQDLLVYSDYKQENGYPYSPHRYTLVHLLI